ncbi:putative transcriptional regulator [Pedobacter sp. UYP24]
MPSVTLQLKNAKSLDLVAYSMSNVNGEYELKANIDSIANLYLIASYIGLKKDTLTINVSKLQEPFLVNHNFNLTDDATQLDEIKIIADIPIITKTNDTTKYNVARLTSPEDQNIESVIKKMPGMTVSKDGVIYFNQQRIAKILLEGDDMTGDNYKTITQNLKPQLVEEVQAIENYVEDDLMNGIISSNEVVLNLKVKAKKSVSGSLDLSYGSNNRNDLTANLVSFTKGFKAFTFVNNNNTGKYQDDLLSLSNNGVPFQTNKFINHAIESTNPFDNNQFRLNKSLAGSISAISQVTDKLKISLGLYGILNNLYDERNDNRLFYTADTIRTFDKENRNSNSKIYQAEWTADQRLNKKSRLVVAFSTTFKPEKYLSKDLSFFNYNPSDSVSQEQSDRLKSISGQLKYVLKLNANIALITTINHKFEDLRQNYNVNSNLYTVVPYFGGASSLLQLASIRTNTTKADIQLLKKSGYNYFYTNIGYNVLDAKIATSLYNADSGHEPELLADKFINANNFIIRESYLGGKYTFDNKRIRLQALMTGSLRQIVVYGRDSSFLVLQPELSLSAKISESQTLKIRYTLENKSPGSLEYYQSSILTDVRNVNSGLNKIYSFSTQKVEVGYNNSDFSKNYFSFQANGSAKFSPFGFLATNFFDNTIYYSQRSLYKGVKIFQGNLVFQKFVPFVASNFSLDLSASTSEYYAAIGQVINPYSDISKSIVFNISTGFKLPVNFSTEFRYLKSNTYLSDVKINSNNSYKYALVSRSKIGKHLFHVASYDLYRLNNKNYRILNTELIYQPTKSGITYTIQGKNLYNVKTFTNTYVSNIQESTSSTSLLGRYLLFKVSLTIR